MLAKSMPVWEAGIFSNKAGPLGVLASPEVFSVVLFLQERKKANSKMAQKRRQKVKRYIALKLASFDAKVFQGCLKYCKTLAKTP